MKALLAVLYLTGAVLLGWYSPAVYQRFTLDACAVNSVVIYNEKNARIFNISAWFSEADGVHYRYSSRVTRTENGRETGAFSAERTLVTEKDFRARYVRVVTADAFRISGPETGSVWPGAFIDPVAEKGFNASVYLFRAGDRWLQGFSGRPRVVCNPVKT